MQLPRESRRLSRREILLLGAAAPALITRAARADIQPPLSLQLPGALVTLDLRDLTLTEAAERFARSTRIPFRMGAADEAEDRIPPSAAPPNLNLTRRATLTWENTRLGDAMRALCKAYDCDLAWDHDFRGLVALPEPFPTGPATKAGPFTVDIRELRFDDRRLVYAPPLSPTSTIERKLSVALSIRFPGADAAEFAGLRYLRLVDSFGRDAVSLLDGDDFDASEISPFPDECRRFITCEWPYPAPHRLKLIEGEAVLYRQLKRDIQEFKLTGQKERQVREVPGGVAMVEFGADEDDPSRLEVGLAVRGEGELTFGGFPHAWVTCENGVRYPLAAESDSVEELNGLEGATFALTLPPDTSPVQSVHLNLVRRSHPDRRVPFRFRDYPTILAPEAPSPKPSTPVKPK
jgi:hypothetical protein